MKEKDKKLEKIAQGIISKMSYQPRDPKRIGETLDLIKDIWENLPDTRFNQLIHNLQYQFYRETGKGKYCTEQGKGADAMANAVDLFHVEDDEFIEFLQKYKETYVTNKK